MRVEESAALNEEEIMFWLTLKRSNTISILTAVMVPHGSMKRNVMQHKVWVYASVFMRYVFSERCQKYVLVPRNFRM